MIEVRYSRLRERITDSSTVPSPLRNRTFSRTVPSRTELSNEPLSGVVKVYPTCGMSPSKGAGRGRRNRNAQSRCRRWTQPSRGGFPRRSSNGDHVAERTRGFDCQQHRTRRSRLRRPGFGCSAHSFQDGCNAGSAGKRLAARIVHVQLPIKHRVLCLNESRGSVVLESIRAMLGQFLTEQAVSVPHVSMFHDGVTAAIADEDPRRT